MMRSFVAASIVVLALGAGTVARAGVFDLYVQGGVGGGAGTGLSGDQKDNDFFTGAGGPGYGVMVGAEVFFIDVAIEHDQFIVDGGVHGTWTTFNLGADVDLEVGDKLKLNVGGSLGYALGTGQQVEPPLDNSEITDKGFIATGRVDLEYPLGDFFALGVTVPVSWGYMTKNGPGLSVNDTSNNYTMLAVTPMLYFKVHFAPFSPDADGEHEKKSE